MSEEKKGWYVLRAISGKENKVKEVLDAEIKNTDHQAGSGRCEEQAGAISRKCTAADTQSGG